jgi:hypothetical protein
MSVNATSPSGALSGTVVMNNAAKSVYAGTVAIIAAGVSNNETSQNGLLGQLTVRTYEGTNFPDPRTVAPVLKPLDAVKAISATLVNGVANGASVGAITARAILK